jgi:hypothetical protein
MVIRVWSLKIIPDPDPDAALLLDLTIKLSRSGKHGFLEKEKNHLSCLKVGSGMIILDPDAPSSKCQL